MNAPVLISCGLAPGSCESVSVPVTGTVTAPLPSYTVQSVISGIFKPLPILGGYLGPIPISIGSIAIAGIVILMLLGDEI